jgi:sugar lactone lactonase YvrE
MPRFPSLSLLVFAFTATRLFAQLTYTTPYVLLPFAGVSSYGHADGRGTAARFNAPSGLATDAAGNLYVCERGNMLLRKITADGNVTTLAGIPGVEGIQDGAGASATFSYPEGMAIDATGNIFVTNQQNVLRKITPGGVVSTLPHVIQSARSLAFDPAGNLYFSQFFWHSIRRITPAGQLEEFAGQNFTGGTVDGPRESALFQNPAELAADATGNLWVAEGSYGNLRKISANGIVSSLPNFPGITDAYSKGLAVDTAGNLVVSASFFGTIAQISPGGQATILAGKSGDRGYVDGPAATARFEYPGALAYDRSGNLFVVDDGSNVIRKITPQGEVSTFAGLPRAWAEDATDGRGEAARFSARCLVARAPNGDLYVADRDNFTIRRITADGTVSTLAGSAGQSAMTDGTGAAARFQEIRCLTTDSTGNIYVGDYDMIRKVTPDGVVTTVLTSDENYFPLGLAVDASGTVFFTHKHFVMRVDSAGKAEIYTGRASVTSDPYYAVPGHMDGSLAEASFNTPAGLTFDRSGNLYVADSGNDTIRKITPAGNVSTLAGLASPGSNAAIDGTGAAARFAGPWGLSTDDAGNVYVGDRFNNLIRKVSPTGQVTTLLGLRRAKGNGSGLGAEARLYWPMSVAAAPDGTLYLANYSQIYQAKAAAAPVIATQPLSQSVTAGGNVQFSVTAGGLPAPTYQWHVNGSPFQGATSSSLSITNARATDAGDYTVVVTNALGSVTSAKATLTVTTTPTQPPASGAGGGGAPSTWFLLSLLSLGALRRLARLRTR